MKNNTKLIMETWRRFLSESIEEDPGTYDPEEGRPTGKPVVEPDLSGNFNDSDFDRETQGPDDYIPDEMIVDEILEYLHTHPNTSDDELMSMFDAYAEDIHAARSKFSMSRRARQQDEIDMDQLNQDSGSIYSSQDAGMEMPLPDSDYDFQCIIKMKYPKFYENSKLPVILSKFAPIEIWAITLGPWVFCRGELSEKTKRHETIHYLQYKELWFLGFLFVYLFDYLWAAVLSKKGFTRESYLSIRFEQEAWHCDDFENYVENRERFAWKNYPLGGEKNEES